MKNRKLKRTDLPFKKFRNKLFSLYISEKGASLIKLDHLNPELWNYIFNWYFHNENYLVKPALNYPRWDHLLHEIGGMQADNRIRDIIVRLNRRTSQQAA